MSHLNAGAALIEGAAERRDFVRWNLAAGRRARAATAFDATFGYLSAAASALDPGLSGSERGLAFDVHAERAEGAYLSGRHEEAEALLAAVRSRGRGALRCSTRPRSSVPRRRSPARSTWSASWCGSCASPSRAPARSGVR
ncbi:hypothetical protein [Sorangium sp. So ce233]|uniref:hypothetical protein n=1 Tax=Sorangium sp. So ce233 TaxID=3133290 RepID=UPI003F60387C